MFDGPMGMFTAAVMARMNAAAEAEAIANLDPGPLANLLVIGFGAGVGLAWLDARLAGGRIVGVDPSAAMHQAASRRLRDPIRAGRVTLLRMTADRVDLPAQSLDGAIAVHALQLCTPLVATATKLAALLKPGARFETITHDWALPGGADAFFSDADRAFQTTGFTSTSRAQAAADRGTAWRFTATR